MLETPLNNVGSRTFNIVRVFNDWRRWGKLPPIKRKEVEKIRDKIIEKLRFLTDLVTDILDEIIDLRTEMETEIDIYTQGTFQEMPSLQAYACDKEREKENKKQYETMLEVQTLSIPVYNAKFIQEKKKEKKQ